MAARNTGVGGHRSYAELGISRERVRQVEERAIEKIKRVIAVELGTWRQPVPNGAKTSSLKVAGRSISDPSLSGGDALQAPKAPAAGYNGRDQVHSISRRVWRADCRRAPFLR